MKKSTLLMIVLLAPIILSSKQFENKWFEEKLNGYSLFCKAADKQFIDEYKSYFIIGKEQVEKFFQNKIKKDFSIFIHPTRASLDSAWQQDWNMPEFNSQCWMVASGVSHKIDIISPAKWDELACEHSYSDSIKTLRLITHELVHVYHGQKNISPDFSEVTGVDWFVEGLAVYASGQCDSEKITAVKKAIIENRSPNKLDKMWTGNLKYGFSGTLVMYLDYKYGRSKIKSLLKYNDIADLINSLNVNEAAIIQGWKDYILKL